MEIKGKIVLQLISSKYEVMALNLMAPRQRLFPSKVIMVKSPTTLKNELLNSIRPFWLRTIRDAKNEKIRTTYKDGIILFSLLK